MLLPELAPGVMGDCGDRSNRVQLQDRLGKLGIPFRRAFGRWIFSPHPAKRLAKIVMELQRVKDANPGAGDIPLIQRLECQLANTGDIEAQKVFSNYLAEP